MDITEKFEYGLVFGSIAYSITNRKTDFSETALIYLDEIKKFFNRVIKGLESVIEKRDYFFVEDLHKIVELAGYKSSHASKKDIKNMVNSFRDKVNQIDKLKQDPKGFYDSKDAQKLLAFCNKIGDLYEDNYQNPIISNL